MSRILAWSAAGKAWTACGRGAGAASRASNGRVAKIGAGCGPFCMKRALVTIARTARVAMRRPTNSRRWPAIAAATFPAAPSNPVSCLRLDRLGTFLHLNVCGHSPSTLGNKPDEIACAGPARAFKRQPDRHTRPLADPALDRDVAPMQIHQTLDDRQTKT